MLGDLALGPRGDVYLTDSYEPVLYRLRPGADTLERITHPLFRSLQGMAATDDDRFVYVADYSRGLLRVRLADGDVRRLGAAAGTDTRGCDGIVLHRGAIVAVQNGASPRTHRSLRAERRGRQHRRDAACSIGTRRSPPSRRSAR